MPTGIGTEALVELITASLDDDKAQDIVCLDLSGKSSITDYLIVASGGSARHLAAMTDHIVRKLKPRGISCAVEGLPQGDWVLIDAGAAVVHLFQPDVRAFYNLEKMWSLMPAGATYGDPAAATRARQ